MRVLAGRTYDQRIPKHSCDAKLCTKSDVNAVDEEKSFSKGVMDVRLRRKMRILCLWPAAVSSRGHVISA